ncbi:V-type ATP synthase subunit F [Actinophytocola sp. NPDC049390]|uniref:V-type ATP synthase subunit F n=1 Tax=Actinophytocola sp. NPDC049390 TaxID=3363894 RepID=UPI0037B5831E
MTVATVAVIGERVVVRGWSLAGAAVTAADDADAVRAAWRSLDTDVAVVVLTPAAASALEDEMALGAPLTVVLP